MYLIAFQPKTPEKKGRKLSFDDVGFEQSNSFEELEASGSSQSPLHPHSSFEELEASGSSQSPLHPHSSFEELEASGSSQTTLHPQSPFEELEASGSSETTFHLQSPFEELEASGSSETTFHPQSPFEELEASGSSSTTLHGSPETLAHSSPLQPLSHIRNTEDLKAGEVSWFPQAKTWRLNVDEIRKVYRDRLERVHDCLECGVILHSHKALAEHEKLDDHVQEKERIENFFNSKAFINPQDAEPIAEPETVGDLMSLIADESFPDLFE
nr:uncharacterized protein LOC118876804 [Drosophila suzukii]